MDDIILVPMQARVNGIIINYVPKELSLDEASSQRIILHCSDRAIPILYNGPIPYFNARYPTDSDMETYEWVQLTSDSSWEPYELNFNNNNQKIFDTTSYEDFMYNKAVQSMIVSSVNTKINLNSIAAGDLSKLWKVNLKQASIILNSTTSFSRQI